MLVLMYAGITLISILDEDLISNIPLLRLAFWAVDVVFCGIFLCELALKVYSFGLPYFKHPLEFIDAAVIITSAHVL